MVDNDPQAWSLGTWLLSLGISSIGGVIAYFQKVAEGKEFSLISFLIYVAVSAFSGLLVFMTTVSLGQPELLAGALSGAAGYMGTSAWKLGEAILRKRIGIEQ